MTPKYEKIFLLGPRGSGKSTIAKILAKKIKWNYLEMDEKIQDFAKKSVEDLTKNGQEWEEFRRLETGLIQNLKNKKNFVVSCGGGVGVNSIFNQKYQKTYGKIQKEIINSYPKTLKILLLASDRILGLRLTGMFNKKEVLHRPFLNANTSKNFGQNKQNNFSLQNSKELLIKAKVRDSMEIYRQRKKKYLELTNHVIWTDKQNQKQIVQKILQLL